MITHNAYFLFFKWLNLLHFPCVLCYFNNSSQGVSNIKIQSKLIKFWMYCISLVINSITEKDPDKEISFHMFCFLLLVDSPADLLFTVCLYKHNRFLSCSDTFTLSMYDIVHF